jgi:N-acetylmuramoyl-L-alanine amidase
MRVVVLAVCALLGLSRVARAESVLRMAPSTVVLVSPRGEVRLPVRTDLAGGPRVSAASLAAALGAPLKLAGSWAELSPAGQSLRLLIGAPLYWYNGRIEPLATDVLLRGDSLFVPLQVLADVLPRLMGDRFVWNGATGRLTESAVAATSAPLRPAPRASGLRRQHVVTIDAGHGGVDPGNPGLFFPAGMREKDVNLAVSQRLRDELKRRGIGVLMTRTEDTLIALGDRGPVCADDCDLFISIHVNSLPKRPGYQRSRGFETYFLAEAKTEDAQRVARMENEAIRYEPANDGGQKLGGGLDFILKDLMTNEHLRESALVAELVQDRLADVHTGPNRGVKQAGFMVLTTARRPAILVELGYSTNPEDGRLMSSPSGQRDLARGIADAIVDYLRRYESKTDATP